MKVKTNHIYCGDALELLTKMPDGIADVIITDPVWPNSIKQLTGWENPYELFAAAAMHFPRLAKTVVIHLGCTSDPRFLMGIPKELPYLRTCWLRYNFPSYRGRILIGSDVAYVFGQAPKSRKGNHVLGGEEKTSDSNMDIQVKRKMHPTARKIDHVRWLVNTFSSPGDIILDPFIGSGTTAVAAKVLGRKYIGIEIEKRFCEMAEDRLRQEVMLVPNP